jgi:TonB family protein
VLASVLALTLATTAPVDTTVRLPGTDLRFGMESSHFGAVQGFQPSERALDPGRQAREGPRRFFGVDSRATLQFEDRRLVEAEFEIAQASLRQIAYVEDDLRRRGYRRACPEIKPDSRVCDWTGATRVRIVVDGSRLVATVQPLGTGAAPEAPSLAERPAEVLVWPDTLLYQPGEGGMTGPLLRGTAPLASYPEEARAAGVQGVVYTLALIDTTGLVIDVRVRRGIAELDSAAVNAVRGYIFEPMVKDGTKWRFWIELPIRLTLR